MRRSGEEHTSYNIKKKKKTVLGRQASLGNNSELRTTAVGCGNQSLFPRLINEVRLAASLLDWVVYGRNQTAAKNGRIAERDSVRKRRR